VRGGGVDADAVGEDEDEEEDVKEGGESERLTEFWL
jgi:hypothetical protein